MTDKIDPRLALQEARNRIASPNNWCKVHLQIVMADGVVLYCALGALYSAAEQVARRMGLDAAEGMSSAKYSERVLADALPDGCGTIREYNDARTTTHADMLALFDRALEAGDKR